MQAIPTLHRSLAGFRGRKSQSRCQLVLIKLPGNWWLRQKNSEPWLNLTTFIVWSKREWNDRKPGALSAECSLFYEGGSQPNLRGDGRLKAPTVKRQEIKKRGESNRKNLAAQGSFQCHLLFQSAGPFSRPQAHSASGCIQRGPSSNADLAPSSPGPDYYLSSLSNGGVPFKKCTHRLAQRGEQAFLRTSDTIALWPGFVTRWQWKKVQISFVLRER